MRDNKMIAGLLRERAGYVQRGDDDHVAQVDEQLAHYGYGPEADDTPPERSSEGEQRTADDGTGGASAPQQTTATPAAEPQPTAPAKKTPARKQAAKKSAAAPPATG